ncbi:MAG: cytochrome c [Novosphingobium sp.]|jgi:mono/diheme cytochrome c family protein|nr:cytochrome c [Novosphingobium sp.]
MNMTRLPALALLALAACIAASQLPQASLARSPAAPAPVKRGQAFAQAHCSVCHAIADEGFSPNPESPPFAAVVNKPGITRNTLRQFLRDSHNFPAAMNFRVEPARIDDLADYMLTLRTPGYRPPI